MTQKISNPQKALVLIDLYLVSQYEVPTPNRGRVMRWQSYYLNKKNKKKNNKKKRCFAWGVRKLVVVFCMESGAFCFCSKNIASADLATKEYSKNISRLLRYSENTKNILFCPKISDPWPKKIFNIKNGKASLRSIFAVNMDIGLGLWSSILCKYLKHSFLPQKYMTST